ncbi:MAG: sigma-70 family RNA polymerase sigma factor [Verrucomicrobiota bacterium]
MKFSAALPGPSGTDSDSDLLRAFAAGRDEAAFRALTERYAGLVHGIAFRRLGEVGAAQEVTSEVFTLLARKASRLTQPGCLAAWLQRSAVLITANAARRETRRRLVMKTYTASLDSTSPAPPPTDDPAWREALGHLDESLAKLPERDRQLLLARFFTGRTHGEIAAETGAGEAAVKKAGQRALEKLRALLLRRGVTLSAAVLASGLKGHVQAAAPDGVAVQASSTALRAVDSLGLFQTLQHSLAYMFYGKTLTTTTAALLLCAALGGGSFLAARQLAIAVYAPPGNDTAATGPLVPAADSVKASAGGKIAARSVTEMVREAVELLRRSRKEGSPEMDRAILLLAGLLPEEMREAARGAEDYREDRQLAEALATALGAAWAERDPAAALAWLEDFCPPPQSAGRGGANKIVLTWFQRDAPAAWDWWKRRSRSSSPPALGWGEVIGEGAGNWARREPAAATAAVGETDVSPELLTAFAGQLSQMQIGADSPAVDAALAWRNPSMRAQLARFLADGRDSLGKGSGEMERLFPLLNKLCANDPGALENALPPLMKLWSGQTPEAAASWVLDEATSSPVNTRNLLQPALEVWGKTAPEDLWRWIQSRIARDAGQAARIQNALLSGDLDTRVQGSRWIPDSSACGMLAAAPEMQDGLVRFWAEQRLQPGTGKAVSLEENLARWREEISVEETKGHTASAALARRALQLAEKLSQSQIPAPAPVSVPASDSPPVPLINTAAPAGVSSSPP